MKKVVEHIIFLFVIFSGFQLQAQSDKEQRKAQEAARDYLAEAEDALAENNFTSAEASYRKAIAKDPQNATARYNLGNLYYNKEKPGEAQLRLKQAAEIASTKADKHKAFHNLGNSFMKQENYKQAVEAYKDALRNNPTDDETRYNLALAKQKQEEQEQEQDDQDDGDGENNDDQDQEQQDQDQQDQDQGGDGENNQDSEDEGDQEQEPEDGENEEQENESEGENEEQEGGNEDGEQEQPQPQPQPQQGKLSPEQIQNILNAMNNEEKKVQDKINAEKAKGAKTQSEKDW